MEQIIIKNINEVYVQIYCDEGIAYELRDAFCFKVPGYQFSPKFRAKLWSGDIFLFNLNNRQIYRGLVPQIIEFCIKRNYTYQYEDEVYDYEISLIEAMQFIDSLNLPIKPRDYQIKAFVHAIRQRRSLLLSPTASGKSLINYMITRFINAKKTLIIVPTISLVSQLATDFAEYGYDSENLVHVVYAGEEKSTDRPITISTWQSLFKMPASFFKDFELVIGDEAHLFKANSLVSIMTKLVNAKYRVGTTGTLDGTKTHKLVLEGLFGPVNKVTTTKELMDQKHLAEFRVKCILLKHSDEMCKLAKKFDYQEEIKFLILSEPRNRFITNLALSLEGNTLLLFQYVEKHGKTLFDMINKKIDPIKGRKVFFIYGKTDVDIREETRKIVETESNAIIVASFGVFSTGVNIRNLHNVIYASPSKSRIRNLQSIGRALRISDTKDKATLYDIADDLRWKSHENYTIKHFELRVKVYIEEKFPYKIYKVEMKG